MSTDSLRNAVERFAAVTVFCEDADLERAWEWKSYDEGIRFAFFRTYEELRELAACLSSLRNQQTLPPSTTQHALGQYHAAYRDLQAVLLGLSFDQMAQAPAPGEWSIKQILPHIFRTSGSFFANIVFALERSRVDGKPPARMAEDNWDKIWAGDPFEQVMENADLPVVFPYYDQLHQRILHELSGITQAELAILSLWWEDEPFTLEFRLHRLDSHFRQHTVQVEKTLAMLGLAPNEAKRLLRLIYNALAEVESLQIGAWDFGVEQCQRLAADITARAGEISQLIHSWGSIKRERI
jgi:mRNA-degrading endonuclease YafQ of YafQ-DinJ toxin-antitoxin module